MLGFPQKKEDFEALIKDSCRDIFLIVDRWEVLQPAYVFPMSHDKVQYLEGLGFCLPRIVYRPMVTKEGLVPIPVIFIFSRKVVPGEGLPRE